MSREQFNPRAPRSPPQLPNRQYPSSKPQKLFQNQALGHKPQQLFQNFKVAGIRQPRGPCRVKSSVLNSNQQISQNCTVWAEPSVSVQGAVLHGPGCLLSAALFACVCCPLLLFLWSWSLAFHTSPSNHTAVPKRTVVKFKKRDRLLSKKYPVVFLWLWFVCNSGNWYSVVTFLGPEVTVKCALT